MACAVTITQLLLKAKTLYINMLFDQLSSVLVCSFWVDGCKDRKNMEYINKSNFQSLQMTTVTQ